MDLLLFCGKTGVLINRFTGSSKFADEKIIRWDQCVH